MSTTEQNAIKAERMAGWRASMARIRAGGLSCTDGFCGAMDCQRCRGQEAIDNIEESEEEPAHERHFGFHTTERGCAEWLSAIVDGLRIVHFAYCPFCGESVHQPEEPKE